MKTELERDSHHNDSEWKYIRSLESALRDALCRLGDSDISRDHHTLDIINKGWDTLGIKIYTQHA